MCGPVLEKLLGGMHRASRFRRMLDSPEASNIIQSFLIRASPATSSIAWSTKEEVKLSDNSRELKAIKNLSKSEIPVLCAVSMSTLGVPKKARCYHYGRITIQFEMNGGTTLRSNSDATLLAHVIHTSSITS